MEKKIIYMVMEKYDYVSGEPHFGGQIGKTEVRTLPLDSGSSDECIREVDFAEEESERMLGGKCDLHEVREIDGTPIFFLMRWDGDAPSGLGYILAVQFCTEPPDIDSLQN